MDMKGTAAVAAITAGAAARLTRFVVTDSLGEWWIKDPVDRAAESWYARRTAEEGAPPPQPWWWKYRAGLDCPFCVGFWIGAGVLAAEQVSRETPLRPLARFLGTALAMNYVVGHLSSRIDVDHKQTEEQQRAANTFVIHLRED